MKGCGIKPVAPPPPPPPPKGCPHKRAAAPAAGGSNSALSSAIANATAAVQTLSQRPAASAPAASSSSSVQLKANTTRTAASRSYEQRVIELVNNIRQQHGLRPLAYNSTLARASDSHNQVMVETRTMSHKLNGDGLPVDRIRAAGFTGGYWGENVAVLENGPDYTPERVVQDWMNSPTHRANILNANYSQIAVAHGATADNDFFYTQTFGG